MKDPYLTPQYRINNQGQLERIGYLFCDQVVFLKKQGYVPFGDENYVHTFAKIESFQLYKLFGVWGPALRKPKMSHFLSCLFYKFFEPCRKEWVEFWEYDEHIIRSLLGE